MSKCYAVMFSSGSYDDASTDIHKVSLDKNKADDYAKMMNDQIANSKVIQNAINEQIIIFQQQNPGPRDTYEPIAKIPQGLNQNSEAFKLLMKERKETQARNNQKKIALTKLIQEWSEKRSDFIRKYVIDQFNIDEDDSRLVNPIFGFYQDGTYFVVETEMI